MNNWNVCLFVLSLVGLLSCNVAFGKSADHEELCGPRRRTTSSGILETPKRFSLNNFQALYPIDINCKWTIKTIKHMTLRFSSFNIEPTYASRSCDCEDCDYVKIYNNGEQVGGRYCSANPPPATLILGNHVTIHFHSGRGDSVSTGFVMTWTSIAAPIMGTFGVITPDWTHSDKGYQSGVNRTWVIQAPRAMKVMVNVTDFNFNDVLPIEKKYWRNFDKLNSVYYWRIGKCLVNAYLKISEGNGKKRKIFYGQKNIPTILRFYSGIVRIEFHSLSKNRHGGFHMKWKAY
ncbi:cubilin-like [Clavelina lepadiformis]|uniref:cubilin-like n=1 Tax=Clavelina lepadiformis TaxID=159417 RepID=UPI0040425FD8